jgi:predicted nucleic-acid-binding protein
MPINVGTETRLEIMTIYSNIYIIEEIQLDHVFIIQEHQQPEHMLLREHIHTHLRNKLFSGNYTFTSF